MVVVTFLGVMLFGAPALKTWLQPQPLWIPVHQTTPLPVKVFSEVQVLQLAFGAGGSQFDSFR